MGVDNSTNTIETYTYTLYNSSSDTSSTTELTQTLNATLTGTWKCETCSYEAAVTAPTCTMGGYTTYTCSVCGYSYAGNETAALGHDWDQSTGNCTRGDAQCAAKIVGGLYYPTLAEAVDAAAAKAQIQMCTNSEETNCVIDKVIYLDLNGKKVTGKITLSDTLYGADSSSDGFQTPGGAITVSGSTVAAVANNVNGKDYVAYSADGKTYSFHRFAITPTACQFYLNPNSQHAHLSVMATLQGNSTIFAQNLVKDLGFQINSEAAKWYGGTVSFSGDKTVSYIALTLDGNSSTDYKKAHSITAMAAFDAGKTEAALVKSNACKITLKTVLDKYISDGGKHAADVQSFLDNLTA